MNPVGGHEQRPHRRNLGPSSRCRQRLLQQLVGVAKLGLRGLPAAGVPGLEVPRWGMGKVVCGQGQGSFRSKSNSANGQGCLLAKLYRCYGTVLPGALGSIALAPLKFSKL